ncbi:hypothetical protein [Sphingobium sp. RAC03]|nr:hypothetical protein [Sphingobium sp. RAC03]AOF96958.1 hypothetical protein BSY17_1187 [Sphingobium sp. RAC03]
MATSISVLVDHPYAIALFDDGLDDFRNAVVPIIGWGRRDIIDA